MVYAKCSGTDVCLRQAERNSPPERPLALERQTSSSRLEFELLVVKELQTITIAACACCAKLEESLLVLALSIAIQIYKLKSGAVIGMNFLVLIDRYDREDYPARKGK